METKKRGRPHKPREELQNETIRLMVTKKDKTAIKKAAKSRGLTVSNYIRLLFVGDNGKRTASDNR